MNSISNLLGHLQRGEGNPRVAPAECSSCQLNYKPLPRAVHGMSIPMESLSQSDAALPGRSPSPIQDF